jgi:hypothetical protein
MEPVARQAARVNTVRPGVAVNCGARQKSRAKTKKGKEMSVFMMPVAPGCCQVCAVKHDPAQPHNAQSLPYQMWFQSTYGRGATWADALAHCSPEVIEQWKTILKEKKAWTEPPQDCAPVATVDNSGGVPTARPMPNMEPTIVKMGRRGKAKGGPAKSPNKRKGKTAVKKNRSGAAASPVA